MSSCLCSLIFQIQNGLFFNVSNSLDCCCAVSKVILFLSNNSKFNSVDAQIQANNDNIVVVTWWEKNKTTNEPVVRISTDNGKTFGPVMRLSANGTISSSTSSTVGVT